MQVKYVSILFILLFMLSSKNVLSQNKSDNRVRCYNNNLFSSTGEMNIPLIGVKTNFLYWAGFTPEMRWKQVLPNLSLELFLGKRWSVTLDGDYTLNLRNGGEHKRYAFSAFGSEIRTWFKGDRLFKGFYGGIYGNGGEFDVTPKANTGKGHTGSYIGAGLTIGYTWMFNRWLGMEVGTRAGFRHVAYDIYHKESSHFYYERTKYKNKVCLDGVFLSLTARFGKYKK